MPAITLLVSLAVVSPAIAAMSCNNLVAAEKAIEARREAILADYPELLLAGEACTALTKSVQSEGMGAIVMAAMSCYGGSCYSVGFRKCASIAITMRTFAREVDTIKQERLNAWDCPKL